MYHLRYDIQMLRERLKDAAAPGIFTLTKYCLRCKNLWLPHGKEASCDGIGFSASLGCRYCIFLHNALKHFDWMEGLHCHFKLSRRKGRYYLTSWDFRVQLELYTPTGHPPAWHGIAQDANPLDAVLSGSPRTSEAYEFIRSCLRDCDANHPECKIAGQGLPTRLLDIQDEGAQQVKLVETESLPVGHNTTYIALSYCWGGRQSLTLKSENLEVMKLGLMVSSLPQTLQDAIAVTRALGQQYLWVDALCIIQNSPSDWEVESSKMASVYRDAYLTIAAATASDVTQGFLSRNYRETNFWYKEPYQEEWINQEACSTILGARRIHEGFGHADEHRVPVLPWKRRGWTLQEQFLSTRLLKYHAYELRWVCQNKSACQCRSDLSCTLLAKDPMDSPTYRLESAQLAHKHWHRIVNDYTARELTDARDKLPAISGLAQVFQQVIQSPYIAGIWEDRLSLGLLWGVFDARYAPELYIAPTFSWASISSPVGTMFEPGDLDVRDRWVSHIVVEDTCSIADGKDPLGRVKDGWIKLRGYLFRATLVDDPSQPITHRYTVLTKYLGRKILVHDTWLEEFQATNEHGNLERSVRRKRQPSVIPPQDNEPSPSKIKDGAVVYLLLIGCLISPRRSEAGFNFLGLGLSSDKPGMYERLGLVKYHLDTGSRRKMEKFKSGLIAAADDHKVITIV
ncbi:heterokaryon incompatibility protein-domain-containing protein [Neurospora hispaniola]|uniref:Heterokaryon incompatibility protein-domain-containing protein n=1 Tax=Neurospora hispaniola TaxID=588809 RepID=A0AAJ0I8I0_9PEZI|nr:heterokaryon incompatibility protein-domain-containing protein [Neurospora hispaniola]